MSDFDLLISEKEYKVALPSSWLNWSAVYEKLLVSSQYTAKFVCCGLKIEVVEKLYSLGINLENMRINSSILYHSPIIRSKLEAQDTETIETMYAKNVAYAAFSTLEAATEFRLVISAKTI